MRVLLLLLAATFAAQAGSLRLKPVASVPSGPYADGVVACYDTDHDGEGELIFSYSDWIGYQYWNILEYRPYNRYEVVQSDTAPLEWTPGVISTGRFWPYDAGDVDRDGKTDLTGQLFYVDSLDTMRTVVCTLESPDSLSYPDSLNWLHALLPSSYSLIPCAYADLDRDGKNEILTPYGRTMVFENVGDNRESLVYDSPPSTRGGYPIADFDLNGRTDFACNWAGNVRICECVGDNEYAQVCSLEVSLVNGNDQFIGHDVDQNGRPEFFVVDARHGGSGWKLLLYMFEATAEHEYAYWLVDSEQLGMGVDPAPKVSLCADLDGDGVEEIIWSCCTHGYILKATGPHQFRREFLWLNNNGPSSICNAADFNGNGYKELFVGGSGKISVFEVEPVRVMYPYNREVLVAGDTCPIRWRVYTPPRCDSVSLFLKTDTTIYPGERFWRLDTIATSLAPTESSYSWVVPDTQLAWAKVLAIAYGPGWQYDESDSAFSIIPSGVVDGPRAIVRDWALTVGPSPARAPFVVRYDVPRQSRVSVGVYDADGRTVRTLRNGFQKPGLYTATWNGRDERGREVPKGVYFYRLDTPGFTDMKKAVLVR